MISGSKPLLLTLLVLLLLLLLLTPTYLLFFNANSSSIIVACIILPKVERFNDVNISFSYTPNIIWIDEEKTLSIARNLINYSNNKVEI